MTPRLRLLALGRPKSGKTGMLASLLNAGFKIAVLDFDLNVDPLHTFGEPDAIRDRLSVIPLRDKLGDTGSGQMGFKDEPTAMLGAFRAIDNWSKLDPDHPWGPVRSWGPDTVLVADSLTGMGDAALNRVLFLNNRRAGNMRDADWGNAMRDQDGWLARLMGGEFRCHVIVTAHLKLIGPRAERIDKGDDTDLVSAKTAISLANAELMPTRYYPSALGRALPQEITRRVPAAILVQADGDKRHIYLKAPQEVPVDIGVPAKGLANKLPVETGLLDIMRAVCGYDKPPQVEEEVAA